MRVLRMLAASLAALALTAAARPAVDWTRRVSQTADGAYVLGNPAAKTRLIEYVSYTCPHCAHFTNEASGPLRAHYIANGGTAIEIRHAVRDPIDFTATVLARCTGPTRFFAAHDRLFATQDQWLQRGSAYVQANEAALKAARPPMLFRMLAKGAGLGPVVNLSDAEIDECLANTVAQKSVLAMTEEAWSKRSIPGTPYFLVNGTSIDNTTNWATLEPHLRRN